MRGALAVPLHAYNYVQFAAGTDYQQTAVAALAALCALVKLLKQPGIAPQIKRLKWQSDSGSGYVVLTAPLSSELINFLFIALRSYGGAILAAFVVFLNIRADAGCFAHVDVKMHTVRVAQHTRVVHITTCVTSVFCMCICI